MAEGSNKKQVNDGNLFDFNNFGELADLDGHLSFTEQLISRYEWTYDSKKKFKEQLRQIKDKQKDKLLNLTVVGEFTSGKSTFINAMLRHEDFLVSSMLQGTTVATTVIEHADKYRIALTYKNGKKQNTKYPGIEDMKNALVSVTSDPIVAKNLHSVKIFLPSEPLAKGFRIIDTPGTNANERWHEDVTVRAIQEMSDIAILIIDAGKPLSQSFINFVKNNLSDMLPQCVFVATRIDMVRKREREGILAYLKDKISQEFELADPIVLPYAAVDVLNAADGGECSELAQASFETEERMLSHMMRLKMIAQTKKMISLIDAMYLSVSERMAVLSDGYKNELNFLLRSQQADLRPFIEKQINLRTVSFNNTARDYRGTVVTEVEDCSNGCSATVLDKLDSQTTIDELKSFTDTKLAGHCSEAAKSVLSVAEKHYVAVRKWFEDEMNSFENAFEELFSNLDILKVNMKGQEFSIPASAAIETANLNEASSYIAQQLSDENKKIFGGAAAGAALGTMVAPGIGTVIGGVLGFLGGKFLAPDPSDVKRKAKEKLRAPLKSYFDNAGHMATEGFDNYIKQIEECIPTEINKYLTKYQNTVSQQIEREKQRISDVEGKMALLKTDMDSISERKFTLQSINRQLNILSGKEA